MDGLKLRTVLDGEEGTRHQSMINSTAVSFNANGLEMLKVIRDESFGEEEAAFLDVKRAEIGE